ncbi:MULTISPECIES: cell division protein FtsL [unclassified Rhizobium]|uniref:cell division protein FtsL n=1 Tax=unclassified Rhizobium TaxID=2613769 RepID=UPI001AD96C75|nr:MULTISPECIES: hypothetical protein [unclassified Rhizobium]MBO9098890.1 hypothetical protein [Rhizobium sp. L58/93]MBO9132305.1 hypothetical protein [Rhizobium sp. B209b/85]MBO9169154.1 hypothetical protein [Rhizobium sp. L245/93]MBO9185105.1 hypothetical protein [Rhizobium sp. E27B/91]QXZ85253.1 hypothetical protein J5287_06965 [Rhizobium sp. K1/93]
MLKTFDIVLIGVMTTAAAVTYTIKHRAELKLEEVHHLEAEIKLEKDTIELLKADWALVVQPNRLERLVANYNSELQLQPTLSTSLVQPNELPMLRSQLPPPPGIMDGKPTAKPGTSKGDDSDADIRKVIADVAAKPAPKPVARLAPARHGKSGVDDIKTGSVKR